MHYHLTKETRIKFSALLMAGLSLRQAAKLLGVHHTTLSREIRHNIPAASNIKYHPGDAHRKAKARRLVANQRKWFTYTPRPVYQTYHCRPHLLSTVHYANLFQQFYLYL